MSLHWIHLVKGPSTVFVQGVGKVLGKDVSNSKVSVRAGKILPFEIDCSCKISIEGGVIWLGHNISTGTSMWNDIIQKTLRDRVQKTILILGDNDTGKSTLSVYLLNESLNRGFGPCCVIDADIGQGDIAPPNTVGGAIINKPIIDLRDVDGQLFEFVGSTSPIGFEQIVIKSIKSILKHFRSSCGICIINTDGYILNKGIDYKTKMVEELRPDLVVCLGHASICESLRERFISTTQVMCGNSPSNTLKSKTERSRRRLNQYLRYLPREDNTKSNIISKNLQQVKFMFKAKWYYKVRKTRNNVFHFENKINSLQIKPRELRNMFVALGSDRKNILGFGIIENISYRRIYIKLNVHNFNKIYLSKSGLSQHNRVEYRITN